MKVIRKEYLLTPAQTKKVDRAVKKAKRYDPSVSASSIIRGLIDTLSI